MSSDGKAVVVRMPAALHASLKAKAARDERSMAQAIRYALYWYVAEPVDWDNGVQLALEEIDESDYVALLDNTVPGGCDDCHQLAVTLLHARRRLTRTDTDKEQRSAL